MLLLRLWDKEKRMLISSTWPPARLHSLMLWYYIFTRRITYIWYVSMCRQRSVTPSVLLFFFLPSVRKQLPLPNMPFTDLLTGMQGLANLEDKRLTCKSWLWTLWGHFRSGPLSLTKPPRSLATSHRERPLRSNHGCRSPVHAILWPPHQSVQYCCHLTECPNIFSLLL